MTFSSMCETFILYQKAAIYVKKCLFLYISVVIMYPVSEKYRLALNN